MNGALGDTEAFVQALGVTIEHVEPDGRCAVYDKYNRIAYICRVQCRGQGEEALAALLERVS